MGMANPGVICEAIGSWQQMSQGDKTLRLRHELHSDTIEMSRKLNTSSAPPRHSAVWLALGDQVNSPVCFTMLARQVGLT